MTIEPETNGQKEENMTETDREISRLKERTVSDINIADAPTVNDIVHQMEEAGGFTGKKFAQSVDILTDMIRDPECKVFLSFPACIISTGTRGLIRDLIRNKWVDYVITTCGTLDHDLARIWKDYYHGSFLLDDVTLHQHGVNRLGNILVPNESYGLVLERNLQPILKDIWASGKKEYSTRDIIWEVGKRLNDDSSIIYWATKNQIPLFVPGITDGAFGSQLWMFTQDHRDFRINLFWDEQELADIAFDAERTGALMMGGGISKHHTIWWNQFRDGLDLAVYITTAFEFDGSLSGAELREAVSWGKINEKARYITVHADLTLILPFILRAVMERLSK